MDDKTKKKELLKKQKASYEDGFQSKCAEHGIDPEELLKGIWTGECSEETVKSAQQLNWGQQPTDPAQASGGGWLGDWGKNIFQGTLGNVGTGLKNLGEATGINRVGRWAGGDTWQAAKGGADNYQSYHNPFNLEGDVGEEQYQGPTIKNLKQWNALDPGMQHQITMAGGAPSMQNLNRWEDQEYQNKLKEQNASGKNKYSWI